MCDFFLLFSLVKWTKFKCVQRKVKHKIYLHRWQKVWNDFESCCLPCRKCSRFVSVCLCVCERVIRGLARTVSMFGWNSMPSSKSYNKAEQNGAKRNRAWHGTKCHGSRMPLHRRVCECYLIFPRRFPYHIKNFLRMHKNELPKPSHLPHSLRASILCKTKFLRCEYNSWNNIEEIHRRRQTHFNAQIQTTIRCSHTATATPPLLLLSSPLSLTFAMAKFLISKQGWFDVRIEAAKPGLHFRLLLGLHLATPVFVVRCLLLLVNLCVYEFAFAFVPINLIKISTAIRYGSSVSIG